MASLPDEFKQASEEVKKLSERPSNEALLSLYGLYKQSTVGDVSGSKPGVFNLKERKKFEAWETLKGMPQDTAMQKYISLVKGLL